METRKSKYEYDKDYYERRGHYYTNGSTAYRLSPIEEALEELRDAVPARRELPRREPVRTAPVRTAPARRREPVRRPVQEVKPKVKLKVVSGLDFLTVFIIAAAMAATLFICIDFLMLKSDMVQIDKDIAAATQELATASDRNEALREKLNAPLDLDYIYAVAVGRLGMVYPSSEQILNYDAAGTGYVRQYEKIPEEDSKVAESVDGLMP